MQHLLHFPDASKTNFEDHLHLARLRRPPPKPQRARACSAAEPPGHVQARKPRVSKERLRKASKERHEINSAPHPTGPLASKTLLKLPVQPCSAPGRSAPSVATEQQASLGSCHTLQHVLPTPSQWEAFHSTTRPTTRR